MREGVAKFADPQKALLKLLARKAQVAGRAARAERRLRYAVRRHDAVFG